MQKTFIKQHKLPSIPGLTDRPRTVKSGRRLKERVTICYRSDLYLNELKRHVISFQEQLQSALIDLKHAKTESINFHTQRVQQMKEKTDTLVMVLQVCLIVRPTDNISIIHNHHSFAIAKKHMLHSYLFWLWHTSITLQFHVHHCSHKYNCAATSSSVLPSYQV